MQHLPPEDRNTSLWRAGMRLMGVVTLLLAMVAAYDNQPATCAALALVAIGWFLGSRFIGLP